MEGLFLLWNSLGCSIPFFGCYSDCHFGSYSGGSQPTDLTDYHYQWPRSQAFPLDRGKAWERGYVISMCTDKQPLCFTQFNMITLHQFVVLHLHVATFIIVHAHSYLTVAWVDIFILYSGLW